MLVLSGWVLPLTARRVSSSKQEKVGQMDFGEVGMGQGFFKVLACHTVWSGGVWEGLLVKSSVR